MGGIHYDNLRIERGHEETMFQAIIKQFAKVNDQYNKSIYSIAFVIEYRDVICIVDTWERRQFIFKKCDAIEDLMAGWLKENRLLLHDKYYSRT